ncbi:putative MFS multidrug transporter [Xylogone sp. PMI_703]|nr:putative MFS multidrug transporter [Xylogone sp. PMI_703]
MEPPVQQNKSLHYKRLLSSLSFTTFDGFRSAWHEVGFTFSLAMSQILTESFVSGFTVILPGLIQSHIVPESSSIWPASVFSLAVASTTLVFGRLADMYGGRRVYIAGSVWLAIWSIVIGFIKTEALLNLSRAFQGIGASAVLPSGLMLMGTTCRPGTRKNIVFSIYGACAPLGFFTAIFLGAGLAAITSFVSYFTLPRARLPNGNSAEHPGARGFEGPGNRTPQQVCEIKMDYIGAASLFFCLNLHHITGEPPYVYTCFALGICLIPVTIYMEGWIAEYPLIPSYFLRTSQIPVLIFSLFLFYGCSSVFLLYASQFMEQIMGASTLEVVARHAPMAVGGCVISIFSGVLLVIAGSVAAFLPHFGGAICPIIGDIIQRNTEPSVGIRKSYQAVFWMQVGCAVVATLALIGSVRIDRAKSDLTFEEKIEQSRKNIELMDRCVLA